MLRIVKEWGVWPDLTPSNVGDVTRFEAWKPREITVSRCLDTNRVLEQVSDGQTLQVLYIIEGASKDVLAPFVDFLESHLRPIPDDRELPDLLFDVIDRCVRYGETAAALKLVEIVCAPNPSVSVDEHGEIYERVYHHYRCPRSSHYDPVRNRTDSRPSGPRSGSLR